MISAFGVEHGEISKSFVNGKWIKATELSAKQADKVRVGGQYKKVRGVSAKDTAYREMINDPGVKNWTRFATGVKRDKDLPPGTGSGATVRLGSKSQGRSYVTGSGSTKKITRKIAAHENQHAKVKRSGYRLHSQIMGNPKKLMREEARADWNSFGSYKSLKNPSSYASGARAAAAKPRKQYKFSDAEKAELKYSGVKTKNLSHRNKDAVKRHAQNIDSNTPHYRMEEKGKKAFAPYRKLHDDFERRGVPQGGSKKKPA